MKPCANSLTIPTTKPLTLILQAISVRRFKKHWMTCEVSKKAHTFLSPTDFRTARFYLLLQVHKPCNPGRPIISGNGSPTEHISLKLLVHQISSYIHDTPDFLRRTLGIRHQVASTAIIGTFDVSSLNTNIPHNEGIDACSKALAESGHTSPPITDIVTLMNHVLTKNNFTFLDKHYLQVHVHGTAMGTRMAPSMACLFMGKLEEHMLASAPCRTWIWWHYINVIFFIWFIDHMNSFHRTIKFTSETQQRPISLTSSFTRRENGLTTDLFVKPTDEHQEHILESDSFKSHSTGAHHQIRGNITCTTSNIIYLTSCSICGIQYIGETKNSLKKRFYGHRSTVKTHTLDTPVGQHFNLPNHSISDIFVRGHQSEVIQPYTAL